MLRNWKAGPIVSQSLVEHLVKQRSLTSASFFEPQWPNDLHDPFLLSDMSIAVERIWQAIKQNEQIGIIGDYDMDGTPGAALLFQFFSLFNLKPSVILPTREDGYGFAVRFVDQLKQQGCTLILTVDCGIRDFAAIDAARESGIDVIVIDHHECPETLPGAKAIINPKRTDNRYPFPHLCGTGVAFKVLQAFFKQYERDLPKTVHSNWLAWSLDLVALATLGDMVPMLDENRLFVQLGMKVLQRGSRPGLVRFINACDLKPDAVTYNDITYKIIPKCNAAGRMSTMDNVFTVLTQADESHLDAAIKRILTYDTQRQLITSTMYSQAKTMINPAKLPPIMVFYHRDWHPGVTGLLASRLSEEYQRPVAILGTLDGKIYRGSMRSSDIPLPEILNQATDMLEKFGGHNEAAGLSVVPDKLASFKHRMEAIAVSNTARTLHECDGTITLSHTDLPQIESLQKFMPWGIGNHEPTWNLANVTLTGCHWLGSNANHLKATIRDNGQTLSVIGFGADALRDFDFSTPVDIVGTLSVNEFRGNRTPQFQIKGVQRGSNG